MLYQLKIQQLNRLTAKVILFSIFITVGIYSTIYLSWSSSTLPSSFIIYGQSPTVNDSQTQSSNFIAVPIQQHLGDNKNDIFAPDYPFRGDISGTFNFTIDTNPVGQSYLLVQIFGSYFQGHTININGQEVTSPLGNFGSTGDANWTTLTVLIDDGILKEGLNSIQFLRNADSQDNFLIDNIIVNWQYQLTS